jgi:signal transduction histidine kinase
MAAQRLGAAACVLHRIDLDNQKITHMASFGMGGIFEKGGTRCFHELKPSGGEQYLQATLQRRPTYQNYSPLPVRLDEIQRDPTIPEHIKAERIALRERFAGSFSVPLFIQNLVYGGMVFYYLEPQDFSDEQIQLGMTFAEQVALAIENAMLRMQSAQAAILSERTRLARDLHDAVTQTLFSASLIADVLPKLWDRNPDVGRQKLDELRLLTRGALSEMRTLLLELRPDTLGEVDLGDLYRHLTDAFTGRTRIPVAFAQEGHSPLPPDVKEVFYRVAQEALNNIAKHAGASQVQVHLTAQDDRAEVRIRDDGCGFDLAAMAPENLGLKIMRERAAAVHAKLDIKSAPGAGTQIHMHWQARKEKDT